MCHSTRFSARAPPARLDANGGFTAAEALATLRRSTRAAPRSSASSNPATAATSLGWRASRGTAACPWFAEQVFRGRDGLGQLVRAGAATGVNLKLVKLGGFGPSLALGRERGDAGSTSWWAAWWRPASA